MYSKKLFLFIGIFVFLFFYISPENLIAQKVTNDIINFKSKKYKSSDYSIDKVRKSHKISKKWVKQYRTSHLNKRKSHDRQVRQLKGWECPSYKTFVYLKRKKLY